MAMVQGSKLADIGPGGTCPDTVGLGMGFETPWAGKGELECTRVYLQRMASTFAGCPALSMLSAGILRKENLKIITFEAGMCMKTNKTMTKCPEKSGYFCLSFGHFRLTNTNFAEIRGEFTVAYNNPRGQTAMPRVWYGLSSQKVWRGESWSEM
jgi:hypothetical protein